MMVQKFREVKDLLRVTGSIKGRCGTWNQSYKYFRWRWAQQIPRLPLWFKMMKLEACSYLNFCSSYHVSFHHMFREAGTPWGRKVVKVSLSFCPLEPLLGFCPSATTSRKVSRLQGGADVQEPAPLWLSQSATAPIPCSGFLNQKLLPPARCPPPNPEGAMTLTGFSNKSGILTLTAQGG